VPAVLDVFALGHGLAAVRARQEDRPDRHAEVLAVLYSLAALAVGAAMLLESGLSFIGLGIRAPTASRGLMVSSARELMPQDPLLVLWPSAAWGPPFWRSTSWGMASAMPSIPGSINQPIPTHCSLRGCKKDRSVLARPVVLLGRCLERHRECGICPRTEMTHMSKRTYVVTGTTGRIGSRVTRGLLDAGHHVTAIGRNPERLRALADPGATALQGDVRDAGFVHQSFAGANAALLVVSEDRASRDVRRDFGDVGVNYANALSTNSVPFAVFVSSVGAHDDRYRGFVLVHRDVEQALDAVPDLNVVHLRAPFFFENLFYWLPRIRARRTFAVPIDPDAGLDMVAAGDVAAAAVRLLLDLDFRGKRALELRGPDVITMRQIADRVRRQLGTSLPVERMTREADVEDLVKRGVSYDFAHLMNDTGDTFSRYGRLRAELPQAAITGTTSIDDFIRDQFAPALTARAGAAAR
jgi:uncharacterized protein YbjT (DUF2867 family)